MPVRTALRALEQEGLVERLGARGYAARSVSSLQIRDAIEVRGRLDDGDLDRYGAYNVAFHDILVAAAGNAAATTPWRRSATPGCSMLPRAPSARLRRFR